MLFLDTRNLEKFFRLDSIVATNLQFDSCNKVKV